jgi:hypothetical protein
VIAWKGFQFRVPFLLIVIHFDSSFFSAKKMRACRTATRALPASVLVSNDSCGRLIWKRFQSDKEKYIPEFGGVKSNRAHGV